MNKIKNLVGTGAILAVTFAGFAVSAGANGTPCPCTPHTETIVSDTTNTVVGDGNAVAVTPHVAWTASIPGATWIWKSGATAPNEIVGFEKSFTVIGTVLSAQLDIATDNSYEVFMDNVLVASDASANNFTLATQDVHNLTANVTSGAHTLRIEVKNNGTFNSNTNPAGLLYKLAVNSEECPTPDCCGDVSVSNSNSAMVINSVTTVSNTGGNSSNGGSTTNKVKGWNNDNNSANGGNGGSVTSGGASAGTSVVNRINKNVTRIRR